ncbi:MAG TPA: hypothetical protein VF186_00905 [Gaiellaceae bacterium]
MHAAAPTSARAFWQGDGQSTIHLGECAVTVMIQGGLGEALSREQLDSDR